MPNQSIQHCCGLFGIFGHPEAAYLTQLGLYAQQHRGQESAGICTTNGRQLRRHAGLGLVSEVDMLRLGRLIESDAIRAEIYQERLDEILSIGAEVDEGAAGLSEAGQTVLGVWEKMDAGAITDTAEGFDEADRSVRERHAAPEA